MLSSFKKVMDEICHHNKAVWIGCCRLIQNRVILDESPEPKARVANTSCGLANFTPVERILFFLTSRPKIPHSRFGAGSESGTFGQGMVKK